MLSGLLKRFFDLPDSTRLDGSIERLTLLEAALTQEVRRARIAEGVLQTITESSCDALIVGRVGTCRCPLNEPGVIVEEWLGAAEKMFGYEASEIIGMSVAHLMPEIYREDHNAAVARMKSKQTTFGSYYGRAMLAMALRKDGTAFRCRIVPATFQLDRQNNRRYLAHIIDLEANVAEDIRHGPEPGSTAT